MAGQAFRMYKYTGHGPPVHECDSKARLSYHPPPPQSAFAIFKNTRERVALRYNRPCGRGKLSDALNPKAG